jgi:hypothetical protein
VEGFNRPPFEALEAGLGVAVARFQAARLRNVWKFAVQASLRQQSFSVLPELAPGSTTERRGTGFGEASIWER